MTSGMYRIDLDNHLFDDLWPAGAAGVQVVANIQPCFLVLKDPEKTFSKT